jgi:FkbM family methyltransferase
MKNKIRSVVQIGANYGDDDLSWYLKKNCPDLEFALFVEANSIHIPKLKECYKNYQNAIIENIAVKVPDNSDKELTIYYHTNDAPQYGIASCNIEHIYKHMEFVPYLKDGEIKSFTVPCITMEDLFEKYQIEELDWLLLDVEGIDAELLLSFDWKKYKIKRVEFEHLHLGKHKDQIRKMFLEMGYIERNSLHEYDWCFQLPSDLSDENKLQGIPSIHCISLEESKERREFFVNQFKKYGVEDKISFHISERFGDVKETLEFEEGFEDKSCDGNKSIFVAHLKNIKNWYDNTTEEYALFCEDDLSLHPVKYWNFTWEDLMEHLPSDWECVQLTYTGDTFHEELIRLQKRRWYFWGIQAFLVKREYAKKLLDTYYRHDRIIMRIQDPEPYYYKGYEFFPDFHKYPYAESLLLRGLGTVYTLPILAEDVNFPATFFLNNPDFYKEEQKPGHFESYGIALNWWKEKGCKKSIKDLTTMIKIIDYFPYFDETGRELLDLRVNLLKDHVDQFIICESNKTHSGIPTKPGLRDAIRYYNLPEEKIRIIDLNIPDEEHLVVEEIDRLNCYDGNVDDINSLRARVRERMQKDALLEVLDDYDDDCMIIHGDNDEIIDPIYIKDIKNTLLNHPNGYVKIPLSYHEGRADLRVYDKNTGHPVHWAMFATNRSVFKKTTPIRMRSDKEVPSEFYLLYMINSDGKAIDEMGWHFSWMGDTKRRSIKAKSFAHYNDNLPFLSNSRYENENLSKIYTAGSTPPCGNVNYVLKEYPIKNLPQIMIETPRMKEFFLPETPGYKLSVSKEPKTSIIVCENFYEDPYSVRDYALSLEYEESDYHRGRRTPQQHVFPGIKEKFEQLLGKKITRWTETYGMCGRFQYCTAEDAIVYHGDAQQWAAVVYLTPDAPYETGTSLLIHKKTGIRHCSHPNIWNAWKDTAPTGLYLDGTPWDEIDKVGNVFNRLIIWDGHCPHAASKYFGFTKETSRLFHIFFFDTDDTPSWVN